MSWEIQGRQQHGWFGSGRSDATTDPDASGAEGSVLLAKYDPPDQGAAATADIHERNVEDLARVIASEANNRPLAEQTMVGQVLM